MQKKRTRIDRDVIRVLCILIIAALALAVGCAPRASYVCDNGKTLEVTFHERVHKITVDTGAGTFNLLAVPASSGTRYSDEERTFWFKGEELSVMVDGRPVFGKCRKIEGSSNRP